MRRINTNGIQKKERIYGSADYRYWQDYAGFKIWEIEDETDEELDMMNDGSKYYGSEEEMPPFYTFYKDKFIAACEDPATQELYTFVQEAVRFQRYDEFSDDLEFLMELRNMGEEIALAPHTDWYQYPETYGLNFQTVMSVFGLRSHVSTFRQNILF